MSGQLHVPAAIFIPSIENGVGSVQKLNRRKKSLAG
jgi:hypothetical protein